MTYKGHFFYTVQETDVGKNYFVVNGHTHYATDFAGRFLKSDVGKRIFNDEGVLQMENDYQFNRRRAQEKEAEGYCFML